MSAKPVRRPKYSSGRKPAISAKLRSMLATTLILESSGATVQYTAL